MSDRDLSPEQEGKLAEALKVAKLAEEKGSQMSELATEIANKYQQDLEESLRSASKSSN